MPPRRRGGSNKTGGRNAAIQAVEKRRLEERDDDPHHPHDNHNDPHQHHHSSTTYHHHTMTHENQHDDDDDDDADDDDDDDDNEDDEEEDDDDDEPPPLLEEGEEEVLEILSPGVAAMNGCLHCHSTCVDIQVRCDECQAFICQTCHWCHEFQANHEIRVCDRCDAFYCRSCDEMDQCDDCGEVVCASCSTLLSCKFCGGGLCEECATACGRCGIVLCSRDAKFAVDCDTCRLSYCLVCLASGSKDPCVRCGHRPSKRMEQLVHLRLKSIYKAFKQSSRSSGGHPHALKGTGHHHDDEHEGDSDDDDDDDPQALLQAAASAASSGMSIPNQPVMSDQTSSAAAKEMVDRYMAEKKKADAAAEALLAELEEEQEAIKSKKSKKKKKKERQQARKDEEDRLQREQEEEERRAAEAAVALLEEEERQVQKAASKKSRKKKKKAAAKKSAKLESESSVANVDPEAPPDRSPAEKKLPVPQKQATPNPKPAPPVEKKPPPPVARTNIPSPPPARHPEILPSEELDEASGEEDESKDGNDLDEAEAKLTECIEAEDIDGIEALMNTLKGVPGRAPLRKNAKKALKRLRCARQELIAEALAEEHARAPKNDNGDSTRQPLPLLKVISKVSYPRSAAGNHDPSKTERVLHLSPIIIGWVIGKGGQRIRGLMEESGAKVWIDQNTVKADDPSIVYISGHRNCVETAVEMLQDLVSNAPLAITDPNGEAAARTRPPPPPSTDTEKALKTPTIAQEKVQVQPNGNIGDGGANTNENVITCDPRFVPLLIGRRGWTIKHIQDSSGARVDIDQTVNPRKIKISGSATSIETATRYVRDVLSYPLSQLQGNGDIAMSEALAETQRKLMSEMPEPLKSASEMAPPNSDQFEAAYPTIKRDADREERNQSPPSSLIMTHDAKSMISASSSLSSTPEPSATPSTKSYAQPIHPGPLLPPEYANSNYPVHAHQAGVQGNVMLGRAPGQGNTPRNSRRNPEPSSFSASLMGLAAQTQNYAVPSPQQTQHFSHAPDRSSFGPATMHHMQQQNIGRHAVPGNAGQAGNGFRPMMQDKLYSNPPPQQQPQSRLQQNPIQTNQQASFAIPNTHFEHQQNNFKVRGAMGNAHGDGMFGHGFHEHQDNNGMAHGLWNQSAMPTNNVAAMPTSRDRPTHTSTSPIPLGFGLNTGLTGLAGQRGSNVSAAIQPSVKDDSQIVDSLFGPIGGTTPEPESLLNDLGGLSINGGGLPGGMWGSTLGGTWGNTSGVEDVLGAAAPPTRADSALEKALLSGLTPMEGSSQKLHHPQESRFGWGVTK